MRDKLRIESRVLEVTQYIIDTKATIRATAEVFRISKSTIHRYVTEKILEVSPVLAKEVEKVLIYNKSQRHLRGGAVTKENFKRYKRTS